MIGQKIAVQIDAETWFLGIISYVFPDEAVSVMVFPPGLAMISRVRQIHGRAFVGSKIRRLSGDDVAALPSLRVFQSDEKTVNGVNHLIGVNDQVPVFTTKNIVAV